MRALVTGASAGIGQEIARVLAGMGHEVILVARRRDRLEALAKELGGSVIVADLSSREECFRVEKEAGDIDILVNNAGFGVFGKFYDTDLSEELRLIDTNIGAVHILSKLYYCRFLERNSGYILNVASIAAFFPGPLFSSYYASKAYVLRLTEAMRAEARDKNVGITAFCPGPVATEFNDVAGVKFSIGQISAERAARAAVSGMLKNKRVVTPGAAAFLARCAGKLPSAWTAPFVMRSQKKKNGEI